ncbi:TlpA family protein disulfide reductase [Caldalkalibacillus salinus]|nr:redoxin domain-containing protein [Caldalkalibacillus salinus]
MKIGEKMPNLTFKSINEEDFSLSQWQGKKILLYMWSSW